MLAGKSGHDDVVDVAVVEGPIRCHDGVVTSNRTHIRMIADAVRVRIPIETRWSRRSGRDALVEAAKRQPRTEQT